MPIRWCRVVVERVRSIAVRVVLQFLNGVKARLEYIARSCQSREIIVAEGDKQYVVVIHYFWDPLRRRYCKSIVTIRGGARVKEYIRCVSY